MIVLSDDLREFMEQQEGTSELIITYVSSAIDKDGVGYWIIDLRGNKEVAAASFGNDFSEAADNLILPENA